jgi:hypothetical protein
VTALGAVIVGEKRARLESSSATERKRAGSNGGMDASHVMSGLNELEGLEELEERNG